LVHAVSCWTYFFLPWIWRRYIPPKRWLTLNGLHGIISRMMILFLTADVLHRRTR
jgi:hypothetical protein